MTEYQPFQLLLLFIAPIYFMLDTSFAIWRGNPRHLENRLAFLTTISLAFILFFHLLQMLLPEKYTLAVAAYLIIPAAMLSAGAGLLLHVAATKWNRAVSFRIWVGVACIPAVYYVAALLLKGVGFFLDGVVVHGMWKQGDSKIGLAVLLVLIALTAAANTVLVFIAYKKAGNRLDRNRYYVLLKSNLIYQGAILFGGIFYYLFYSTIFIPAAAICIAAVVWGVALRYFMKYNILPTAEKKYELLYRLSPSAIIVMDPDMQLKEINPEALKLFGFGKEEEMRGTHLTDYLPPVDRTRTLVSYQEAFPDGEWNRKELHIIDRQNGTKTIEMETEIIVDGSEWQVLAVMKDITEQREKDRQIQYMAHYDTLTKLPNRYLFNAELDAALAEIHSRDQLLGVLLIDMDRFKLINDTLGHSYGDAALIEITGRLTEAVGEGQLLARLGGDEFIVLHRSAMEYDDIVWLAESVLNVFQQPITLLGQNYYLRGSIGISVYPYDGDTTDGLFKKADIAMYNAKHSGGNQYRMYADEMIAHVQRDMRLEKHLSKACEREEWVLHYQPQIDLRSGRVIGAEALIRWDSEQLGIVYPGEFISLAEQNGFINDIGQWVIREACKQGRQWQDRGWQDFILSVNVSSRQLEEPNFVRNVKEALQASGLHPSRLCLEITESMVVNKLKVARYMLDELVEAGIHIAIDDFGTGYSSLSVLRQLPISIIKIDRSFITDLETDREGMSIVKTIVSMGRDLYKQIIAEGVESSAQADHLRQLGCDKAQGYYFHKPLPTEQMELLLLQTGELEAGDRAPL